MIKQNNDLDSSGKYSTEEMYAVVEACLFAAGHPLTYARLGEVLGMTTNSCKDFIDKMASEYNVNNNYRGIILVRFPDSCQLCTKEKYSAEIKIALGIRRGGNLSQSLLEALAVIAYNQPTTRAFVDAVRGVDSSYAVNALQEKSLIESCGNLDTPGKPTLFRTTADFLRVFGLSSIDELPVVTVKNSNGEDVELPSGTSVIENTGDEESDNPDNENEI